jgi:hypothetical protein
MARKKKHPDVLVDDGDGGKKNVHEKEISSTIQLNKKLPWSERHILNPNM